jgi:hypothetical protein
MGEFVYENFSIGYEEGKLSERERIIEMIKEQFGEDYYDMGVCGQIVKMIKEAN